MCQRHSEALARSRERAERGELHWFRVLDSLVTACLRICISVLGRPIRHMETGTRAGDEGGAAVARGGRL